MCLLETFASFVEETDVGEGEAGPQRFKCLILRDLHAKKLSAFLSI